MAEEKKEAEISEEDKAKAAEAEEAKKKSEEEEGSEGDKDKEDFAKEGDVIPASKHNQALRKAREAEARERELKKEIEDLKKGPKSKEEEESDDSGEDDEEEDGEKEKAKPDASKVLDEKLKPVLERLNQRDESDRKLARTAFFEAHPEYLSNGEKFQELLDEMDNSINPNSKDDYYTQLEKTHRILVGDSYDAEVENKKKDMANDAASGGDGAEKGAGAKDEFTAEDRKIMKENNISEEGMRAYKKKIESGDMQIFT